MPGTVRLCIFPPFCPPPARGELSRHFRNLPFLGFTAVVSARPPACMPRSCCLPDARPPPPAVHSISPSAARDREGCPAARFRASCTDHRGAFCRDAWAAGELAEMIGQPAASLSSFCSRSMHAGHRNPGSRCRAAIAASARSEPRSQRGGNISASESASAACGMQIAGACVHGYQRPSAPNIRSQT